LIIVGGACGSCSAKPAIQLAAKPLREAMRGIVAIGNQRRAMQAGTGDEPIRIRAGDAQDVPPPHAIADRADAAWTHRLAAIHELDQGAGIFDHHRIR
jgi:hypothetical protein